jgi:molybdenum cofactor cytidylyltransferase
MRPRDESGVAGLVLAAGGSRRLGQPKQLLPFGERTLLDHTLATARACGFDQLVCVLGGAAQEVNEHVDLSGVDVVENRSYGTGCGSSIAAGVGAVRPRCGLIVLLLGDQPGVTPAAVEALLAGRAAAGAPLAACRYDDGRGHPLAFARSVFPALRALHGDKGVWRLLDERWRDVVDVPIAGRVPHDVDTWEEYEAALAEAGETVLARARAASSPSDAIA